MKGSNPRSKDLPDSIPGLPREGQGVAMLRHTRGPEMLKRGSPRVVAREDDEHGLSTGAEAPRRGVRHGGRGPWGLRRDYVLFDEVHVWKQILLHQG